MEYVYNMAYRIALASLLVIALHVTPLTSSKTAVIQGEINDIWTKYGEVKSGLDALESQVEPRKTQIENIEMSMTELEQSLTSIRKDVSRLKSSVRRIKKKSSNSK
ncbi:uncharacterized protein LOC132550849 [Ylistrum balloti]|uniref:uncharacterized protein LOC132550849 n=1 Tax=Ylistrum balloti TaxID=509963 RepID=UPI0029059BDF|nr:uncharacterized protein LOC132550849 [Ylistrum balloti]